VVLHHVLVAEHAAVDLRVLLDDAGEGKDHDDPAEPAPLLRVLQGEGLSEP
jgi:hypothetical protein